MPDRPVTPDRPDDLIREARERQGVLARITSEARSARMWTAEAVVREDARVIRRLTDALEAAQKERDELRERLSGSVEGAFDSESDLQARVRQLEEALTTIAGARREYDLTPSETGFDFVDAFWFLVRTADDALAAKENT